MDGSEPLVRLDDLDDSQVTAVDSPHGLLAVGSAAGEPFAVSNRCRHLGASLGEGRVAEDGCLECPWHRARYDVATGRMTRGPQGALFAPVRGLLRMAISAMAPLRRFPTSVRDGSIVLVGEPGGTETEGGAPGR